MSSTPASARIDYLDAVRAFALLLGIVFHASLSFLPIFIGWAVQDVSTSPLVGMFVLVSHSFRMELFFLIAGFFGRMTLQRVGTRAFVGSRAARIVVPFVIGWFILRPLIISGWHMGSASLRGDVDIWAGLQGGFQTLASLPQGLFIGSHLWFLYYLVLVTTIVLLLRAVLCSSPAVHARVGRAADATAAWLGRSPLGLPLLALATAGALWFMRGWGMDTPDQSLVPHVPVLLVYLGCFGFGWILQRHAALLDELGRLSVSRWILAGAGVAGVSLLIGFQVNTGHEHFLLARIGFAVSYGLMMWSLVGLTLGVFQRLCRRPNAVVRYVADSSYWMYLIHLPVVVWLQVAVAELPLHWSIKLLGVSAATIACALLSYDLVVRSTVIGRVLNGRARDRAIFRRRPAPATLVRDEALSSEFAGRP